MLTHRRRRLPLEVIVRPGWRLCVLMMLRVILMGQLWILLMGICGFGFMMLVAIAQRRPMVSCDDAFGYWQLFSLFWLAANPLIVWSMYKRGAARVSPYGICPEGMHAAKGMFRYWSRVSCFASVQIDWDEIVGVGVSRFRGWFRVVTRCQREFVLPELPRASDPEEYLEAVERYAGEDHVLAVALRASWERRV